jgi:hypothetical protein
MSPDNFPPYKLQAEHLFVLKQNGTISQPPEKADHFTLTSESPIFLNILKDRKAGAVLHSRSNKVLVASEVFNGAEYRIKNQGMIRVRNGFLIYNFPKLTKVKLRIIYYFFYNVTGYHK